MDDTVFWTLSFSIRVVVGEARAAQHFSWISGNVLVALKELLCVVVHYTSNVIMHHKRASKLLSNKIRGEGGKGKGRQDNNLVTSLTIFFSL